MKTPEESTVGSLSTGKNIVRKTNEVAGEVIEQLDKVYSRHQVEKIAEWVHYLSTQD